VFWREIGAEKIALADVVEQAEALTTVAAELDRRLAHAGVGGLEGAVAIYERLRDVFDGISIADVERMARRVAELQAELALLARRIESVRELKIVLDREPGA
jgi:hypothetical protein